MAKDDDWKDKSASEEEAKDHAAMIARTMMIYVNALVDTGFTRAEAIPAATTLVAAGLRKSEF